MATGDILSTVVSADSGNRLIGASLAVTAAGMLGTKTTGTFLMDAVNSTLVDISTAKAVLSIASPGFSGGSATTRNRTAYCTIPQRRPYIYPGGTPDGNEVSNDGTNTTFSLVPDTPIYSGDTVTLTARSALYTLSGVPTNAATNLAVTNSTSRTYNKGKVRWAVPNGQRVTEDFQLRLQTSDPLGTDCVQFIVTDQHSHTYTATVTQQTWNQRSAQYLGNNLGSWEWTATIPISGFTLGDTLTIQAKKYPLIGTAPFDTATDGAGDENAGNDNLTFYYIAAVYASVNSALPDNSGGATSSTIAGAQATRYKTIDAASTAGANVIMCYSTSTPWATANVNRPYWLEITKDPAQASACTLTLNSDFMYIYEGRLKINGLTVAKTGIHTSFEGTFAYAPRAIWFNNCPLDGGSFGAYAIADDFLVSYFTNCTSPDAYQIQPRGYLDGCSWTLSTPAILYTTGCFACYMEGASIQDTNGTTISQPNPFARHSVFLKCQTAFGWSLSDEHFTVSGNVIIAINAAYAPGGMISLGNQTGGASAGHTATSCEYAHNSIAGPRCFMFYASDTPLVTLENVVIGNAHGVQGIYIQTDADPSHYDPANGGTTNWQDSFGLMHGSNIWQTSSSGPGDYRGLGSCGPTGTGSALGFTTDNSGSTGDGDLTPTTNSVLYRALVAGQAVLAGDMFGTAFRNDGTDNIGAINNVATGPGILLSVGTYFPALQSGTGTITASNWDSNPFTVILTGGSATILNASSGTATFVTPATGSQVITANATGSSWSDTATASTYGCPVLRSITINNATTMTVTFNVGLPLLACPDGSQVIVDGVAGESTVATAGQPTVTVYGSGWTLNKDSAGTITNSGSTWFYAGITGSDGFFPNRGTDFTFDGLPYPPSHSGGGITSASDLVLGILA